MPGCPFPSSSPPKPGASPVAGPLLRPGDLIGFCDRGPLGISINLATGGIPGWGLSHIGMIGTQICCGSPLLFESTTLADRPCAITDKLTSGVQSHYADERIAGVRGRVWHYPLRTPLSIDQCALLRKFLDHHIKAGTDYDALGAFRSRSTPLGVIERLFLQSPENLSRLFCSEFVAAAWKACGVWNAPNSSRWNPNSLARSAVRTGIVGPRRRLK